MTALRVGYTCHDAFPSTNTNTQQIFWTTSEIARLGHRVDLHVPALNTGHDARTAIADYYGSPGGIVPDTLRFVASGSAGSSARSTAAKALFDLRAPWSFSRRTHDLIWTRDPVAFAMALQCRVPAVFETYRPDYATSARFTPWRVATIGHSRRMAWVGEHRMAGVIAHSTLARDAFVEAGVPADRVLVAHNGFAPSLMEPRLSRHEARETLGLSGTDPLVVYAGHVGPHKGTRALVSLAAALPDIRLLIVGAGDEAERRWVAECGERAGARNLAVVPRVRLSEVAKYLYAADCLLIPPTGEPLERYRRTVLPMKVFSYMAAGRPIVAPALPDIEEVLAHDDTACLVPPDDTTVAASALQDLLLDPQRSERLAWAALAASLRWSRTPEFDRAH